MSEKRFYWLKLKRDFFKRHDIRIVESMDNGKDYILFYLKLLCESVDHDGNLRFSDEIPYNEEMLATITNTNVDIVRSAVTIFAQLGMMEVMPDGTYYMREVSRMIGSAVDSDAANRQRRCRERKREEERNNLIMINDEIDDENLLDCDKMSRIVTKSNADVTECVTKNNESKSKSKSKSKSNIFTPPSLEEVKAYCDERKNGIEPEQFIDYYESNGWMVGKNKMKDWKASVRTWERNGYSTRKKPIKSFVLEDHKRNDDLDDFEKKLYQAQRARGT